MFYIHASDFHASKLCVYDHHTNNNHIVIVEISIQISFELNYSILLQFNSYDPFYLIRFMSFQNRRDQRKDFDRSGGTIF